MPTVGQIERRTQQRVVKMFREQLGHAPPGTAIGWRTNRDGGCGSIVL
jgi:hypothetical protein